MVEEVDGARRIIRHTKQAVTSSALPLPLSGRGEGKMRSHNKPSPPCLSRGLSLMRESDVA